MASKQAQNIPLNFNYDDPEAMRLMVEALKNIYFRVNDMEKRIKNIENRVFK